MLHLAEERGIDMRQHQGTTVAFAVAAVLAGTQAHSQSAPARASDSAASLSEVVVTASRRKERIVDVPYAITAVSNSEIEERGSFDLKQLQYSIPSLAMNPSNVIGADRIQLRGIDSGSGTGLPTVGIYVDDVGISIDQQQRDPGFPLVDLERIEVLRGPQGTLYGQGSVSGTIRYLTRDPSLTEFEGFADATLTSVDKGGTGYRLNGALGAPIVEGASGVRFVAGYDKSAGWIDYASRKDANESETKYARIKALYDRGEALSASLLYQYLDVVADANNVSDPGTNERSSEPNIDPASDQSQLVNLIVNYDFGGVELTSSTGYLDRTYKFDASGRSLGLPAGLLAGARFDTDFEQLTQEFRLASTGDGPFRYVIGAWYRDFDSRGTRGSLPPPALQIAAFVRSGTDPVNSEATAVFGDVTYVFSDKLEASVGLRWYDDERTTENVNNAGVRTSATAKFDATSPRFNLLYKWSDSVSTYATVAKGFRSGGFNANNTSYDAETLWSYEIGTKAALLDGRLYLDAAVYSLRYDDRQSGAAQPLGPAFVNITTNGGEASGEGLEFALTSQLGAGFTLAATVAWNGVEYDNTTFERDAGTRFDYVPETTASLSLSQRIPIGSGGIKGFWRADYQYADGFPVVARRINPSTGDRVTFADLVTEDQSLLNLRVGFDTERYSVTLGVENVLDEDARTFPSLFVANGGVRVRPMTYSLNLRYNW